MRRQATTSRLAPAGSSRGERLDPFALPLRFEAADRTADGHLRQVELHRERVVVRRALGGIKMALHLPVAAYRGVAIRIEEPTPETAGSASTISAACCCSTYIAWNEMSGEACVTPKISPVSSCGK